MKKLWTISEPDVTTGLVYITGEGGGGVGGWLTLKAATELAEHHNLYGTPEYLGKFYNHCMGFLRTEIVEIIDSTDKDTSRNYWILIMLMADGLTAQLKSAVEHNLIKQKEEK